MRKNIRNFSFLLVFLTGIVSLSFGQGVSGGISIDNGASITNNPDGKVDIYINADGAREMQISNDGSFRGAMWEPYSTRKPSWRLLGEDGVKTVYAKFRDAYGNVSEVVSATIEIDREPPSNPQVIINSGLNYTNNRARVVNIEFAADGAFQMQVSNRPDFAGARWYPYRQSVTNYNKLLIGNDGPKILYARYQDRAGNVTQVVSDTITLDLRPPTRAKVEINNNDIFTKSTKVDLKTFADGASEMIIQGGEGWIPYQEQLEWELLPGDGEKVLRVKFRDEVGNESPVVFDKIIVDTTPPSNGFVRINNGMPYTRKYDDISLKVLVRGASEMLISQDPEFKGARWEAYKPIVPTWPVDTQDGLKTIYVKFRDAAGNESEVSKARIFLDTTPPSDPKIEIFSDDIVVDKNRGVKLLSNDKKTVNLKISAKDAAYMMVSNTSNFFGGEWQAYSETVDGWELDGNNDGEREVFVKFRDKAGNVSGSAMDRVFVDTQRPVDPKVIINKNSEYCIDPEKKVHLEIFVRGASKMMVSNDPDFVGAVWEPYSTGKDWVLDGEDGLKSVFVKFKDDAENESDSALDNIILDRKPPFETSLIINKGEEKTNHPDAIVIVKVQAKDAITMQVSNNPNFDGARWTGFSNLNINWNLKGSDGIKGVYARFKDEAGNISEAVSDSILLDRRPPMEGSVTINGGEGITNNANKEVILNLKADGAEEMQISNDFFFRDAQWVPYQESAKWVLSGPDGLKTVYARFRDDIGNVSKMAYAQIGVDLTAPANGSITINKGATYCTDINGYVFLKLSTRDATEMIIANKKDFSDGEWVPYKAFYPNWVLDGEDGEKIVYAKFRDDAKNETVPVYASIILDRQEPVGQEVIINNGDPYTNNKEGQVSLELRVEGATEMMVSNSPYFRSPAQWVPYKDRLEWTLLQGRDGEKTVYAKFRDKALNESSIAKGTILLDTEPPIPQHIKINGGKTSTESTSVTLDIKARGAKYMMVSPNANFSNAIWEDYTESKDWALEATEGLQRVFVKFKDDAQNVSGHIFADITFYKK